MATTEHLEDSEVEAPAPPSPAKRPRQKASPHEPSLVVQHNLSASNLEHADKLGGLAAPSLAVVHKDHGFNNFGEISLLAHHSMIDPRYTPVYDADVYSPRYPTARYRVNEKPLKQFKAWLQPYAEHMGSEHSGYNVSDKVNERGHMGVLEDYDIQRAMKLAFLNEHGVQVPQVFREKQLDRPYAAMPAFQEYVKQHGFGHPEYGSEQHRALSEAAKKAIDQYAEKKAVEMAHDGADSEDIDTVKGILRGSHLTRNIDDETGLHNYGPLYRLLQDAQNTGKNEVDSHAMQEAVDAEMKKFPQGSLEAWAKPKLQPMEGEVYMPKGQRKMRYDLDSVLKEVTRKVRGGENFNYGLGSARALGAKKFRDINGLIKDKHKLVTHEEFDAKKKAMDDEFGKLAEQLAPYHSTGGGSFGFLDSLSSAIGDSYKRGKWLGQALRENAFSNVPPHLQEKMADFARRLREMPTEYFEAKPQRAVDLGEFRAAVVPHDVSQGALDILKRHGVKNIERYQRNRTDQDAIERRAAVERVARAHDLMLSEGEIEFEDLAKAEDQPGVSLVTAYNDNGELLLGRRNDNGKWTLPGGHLNPGEDPREGAERELYEETGLRPTSLSFLREWTTSTGVKLNCFSAFVHGEPHSELDPDDEVSEWKWVDVSEGLPSRYYNNMHGPEPESGDNLVANVFDLGKAESLEKMGAAARLFPFNPDNSLDENDEEAIAAWQGPDREQDHRDLIPYMHGNERKRALLKLAAATQTRRAPDGEVQYLLHRGMGDEEHAAGSLKHGLFEHPDSMSSWTPKWRVAYNFASSAAADPTSRRDQTVSAWINESNIHSIPKQYGQVSTRANEDGPKARGPNGYYGEHEVIVSPHQSQIASPDEVAIARSQEAGKGKLDTTLNGRINRRGGKHGDTAHFQYQMGQLAKSGADDQLPQPQKQDLGIACPHGRHVYLVDGEFVRDHHDSDFTQGGNGFRYRFIPRDEIWVDDDTPHHEIPYVVQHECQESEKMLAGESYEHAHDEAKRTEDKERHADPVEMTKAESDLGHGTSDEYGVHFETGHPVSVKFLRNRQPAPNMGEMYQQHIEPAGRYMIHNPDPGRLAPGWEAGEVHFQNPLVLKFNHGSVLPKYGVAYDDTSWKARLQRGLGATGKTLSRKLARLGHDGVVTVDGDGGTREVVDLTGFHKTEMTKAEMRHKDNDVYATFEFGEGDLAEAYQKKADDKYCDSWKGIGVCSSQGSRVVVRAWNESNMDDFHHLVTKMGGHLISGDDLDHLVGPERFEKSDDDLQKMQTPPTFPKLGVPDNRREIPIVNTPEELKSKKLSIGNHISRAIPRLDPGAVRQRMLKEPGNGMVPSLPESRTGFATGQKLLLGKKYRKTGKKQMQNILYSHGTSDMAMKNHEDFHIIMNRVEELHGKQFRQKLARRMFQAAPWESHGHMMRFAASHGYPVSSPAYYEEAVALLHDYLNNPGEREIYHMRQNRKPDDPFSRKADAAMKTAHRAIRHAAANITPEDINADRADEIDKMLGKAEGDDEIQKLINHPDPIERTMALKLEGVKPAHLVEAAVDSDPTVHQAAINHPMFGEGEGHILLSHQGLTGSHPLDAQLHFLSQAARVTPGHINAFVRNIGTASPEVRKKGLDVVVVHPNLTEANVRTIYRGHGAGHEHRLALVQHANAPLDVLEHAVQAAMLFPSDHAQEVARKAVEHEKFPSSKLALDMNDTTPAHVVELAAHALAHGVVSPEDKETFFARRVLWPQSTNHQMMVGSMLRGLSATPEDIDRALAIPHQASLVGALASHAIQPQHLDQIVAHAQQVGDQDLLNRAMQHPQFGNRHLQALMQPVQKNEAQIETIEDLAAHPSAAAQLGFDPGARGAFKAARFLAGGSDVSPEVEKRALYAEGGNLDAAALRAYGFEVNDDNLAALRAVADVGEFDKGEDVSPNAQEVLAVHPEGEGVAEAVRYAYAHQFVVRVKLGGKHSSGSMIAHDDRTGVTWLLKSGSHGAGVAAGASQDPSNPNAREAAWYHIAAAWGVAEAYPRAELVSIDGHWYAAMEMLPWSYKSLEDRRKNEDPNAPRRVLAPYLHAGLVHQWAAMDLIFGNPDSHGDNVLTEDRPEGLERHRHEQEAIEVDVQPEDVKLIDHGSAFAGSAFDPAHDQASFVPYVLRAWAPHDVNFNALPAEEKLKFLPRVASEVERDLREWFLAVNLEDALAICQRYGIDPEPQRLRYEKLGSMIESYPFDEAVNRLWVTT
jgi:8-oxo-dGTP pyrophosphatase MutT (NUDIX family)